jgi:hypothetical protein
LRELRRGERGGVAPEGKHRSNRRECRDNNGCKSAHLAYDNTRYMT